MSFTFDHMNSLVLLAGISGAGRSAALADLSDFGYYAVDNLPIPLLPAFLSFTITDPQKYSRTALTLNIGSEANVSELLELLPSTPENLTLIFLDCATEVILKRYSETRRPHPLYNPSSDVSLEDTVQRERNWLDPLKYRASLTIDTTSLTIHELRRELRGFVDRLGDVKTAGLQVNIVSFGFKYGAPRDCDLLIDIRFLPNPHFVPTLKERVGLEQEVAEYVLRSPEAQEFLDRYSSLLAFLLPRYAYEGKAYLTIGVGCTGGRHRSVAIAEELAKRITDSSCTISVKHRDIRR